MTLSKGPNEKLEMSVRKKPLVVLDTAKKFLKLIE